MTTFIPYDLTDIRPIRSERSDVFLCSLAPVEFLGALRDASPFDAFLNRTGTGTDADITSYVHFSARGVRFVLDRQAGAETWSLVRLSETWPHGLEFVICRPLGPRENRIFEDHLARWLAPEARAFPANPYDRKGPA
ncbi:hypothetical protein [Embleya sp. NPDC059237]|uniref:hypothetical protein n=1 Tax=Embleya sp. NPDC059237 TaxID=3346784 RepID=UPI00368D026F